MKQQYRSQAKLTNLEYIVVYTTWKRVQKPSLALMQVQFQIVMLSTVTI